MTYDDLVLFHEPILYLPLNEASGPFYDLSGYGRHATLFNNLTRNSTFRTVQGQGGVAVGASYDGYIISQLPLGDLNPFDFSIEFWFATTASHNPSDEPLITVPWHFERKEEKRASTLVIAQQYGGFYNNIYHKAMLHGKQGTNSSSSSSRDDQNYADYAGTNEANWSNTESGISTALRHVVWSCFKNPTTATQDQRHRQSNEFFINGVNQGGGSGDYALLSIADPSHTVGLGILCAPASMSTQTARARNVWLSRVAVYNKALTPAQVLQHYQAGVGTLSGNRVAGSTLLDGVATGGFPVIVHRRDTGAVLGRTKSLANGSFSCNVGSYSGQVYAVAVDPVSGLSYPAQIYDLIVPAP